MAVKKTSGKKTSFKKSSSGNEPKALCAVGCKQKTGASLKSFLALNASVAAL